MMKNRISACKYKILNKLITSSCRSDHKKFIASIKNVKEIQNKILFSYLKRNKDTQYGRKYNFRNIKTIKEFQDKVPLSTYDSYLDYIKNIADGQNNILTKEQIFMFEPSSGSTSASKLIPYTKSLKNEFQKAISPWLYDMYKKRNLLNFGKAYWSITPVSHKQELTSGGIPIGFDEDTEYFGSFRKYLMDNTMAVPPEVKNIVDFEKFCYVTQLFLMKNENITFLSFWNPTFLTIILKSLFQNLTRLVRDIKDGTISVELEPNLKKKIISYISKDPKRAKVISMISQKNKNDKSCLKLFPNLQLISCWSDGYSKNYIKNVEEIFPGIEIKGKGLISTEAFVSFPLFGLDHPILAVNSHFFEFIEVNSGQVKLAHELNQGKKYSVVVTTGGGLYRYKLQDIIQVTGFHEQAPLFCFIGKDNHVSDIFGEKINANHITSIFSELFEKFELSPNFCMVAPEKNRKKQVSYVIYIECAQKVKDSILKELVKDFDVQLQENYHYNYCRKISQLAPCKIFRIQGSGVMDYTQNLHRHGMRVGDIKQNILVKDLHWSENFKGNFVV
tara:strand:+ start:10940 stop:12619 length:1680 start_codon:yes stop_codon:yes gene_type:complete